MKNYLRNYITPNEQRSLMIFLAIGFISLLAVNMPINTLYSKEVSPDSIKSDIEKPYKLCLDVRSASKEELMQIKGIGSQTADKIISFRDSVKISSNYDLLAIKGIGNKSLAKWLPYLQPLAKDKLYPRTNSTPTSKLISNKNKLDINSAQKSDLMKVKGIGENRAQQIIDFRDKMNGLSDMQELLTIKGIGKKTLAKIEELFYIGQKK